MNLQFDEDANSVAIRLEGTLDRETILAAFDAAVEHPDYRPGMARLWDFRGADLSQIDSSVIAGMAQYSTRFPPGINDVRVAFVTSRELEYGLARMFASLAVAGKTSVAAFQSMEEAEAWLATGF